MISFDGAGLPATQAAIRPLIKPAQKKLAMVAVPHMPLPASLTGIGLGFARPVDVPPAPEPQNPPGASLPASASAPQKYTGDPISVNLKDVDLKDFFRLIHEISGLKRGPGPLGEG